MAITFDKHNRNYRTQKKTTLTTNFPMWAANISVHGIYAMSPQKLKAHIRKFNQCPIIPILCVLFAWYMDNSASFLFHFSY